MEIQTAFTALDLATYVGVGRVTVYNWIAAKKIPDPTEIVGRRVCWSVEAANKIKDWHAAKKQGVKMDD